MSAVRGEDNASQHGDQSIDRCLFQNARTNQFCARKFLHRLEDCVSVVIGTLFGGDAFSRRVNEAAMTTEGRGRGERRLHDHSFIADKTRVCARRTREREREGGRRLGVGRSAPGHCAFDDPSTRSCQPTDLPCPFLTTRPRSI